MKGGEAMMANKIATFVGSVPTSTHGHGLGICDIIQRKRNTHP